MNRRDTILLAVLINAGLLIILFATASNPEHDNRLNLVTQQKERLDTLQKPSLTIDNNEASEQDEVDLLLEQLTAQSKDIQGNKERNKSYLKLRVNNNSTSKQIIDKNKITVTKPSIKKTLRGDYLEIVIKQGDVLERIARNNGVSVGKIMEINALNSTQLQIGQRLRLPIHRSVEKSLIKEEKSVLASVKNDKVFYTIKRGDTPWSIAIKHKISLSKLLKVNNLDEEKARSLKPGNKLRIR